MKEFNEKIKDVVQHAAGENEVSDEALQQIAAGVASDLKDRFKQAGVYFSPSFPESSSEITEDPSSKRIF